MVRIFVALSETGLVNAACIEDYVKKENWEEIIEWIKRGDTVKAVNRRGVTIGIKLEEQ